jgi:hypothetical protein
MIRIDDCLEKLKKIGAPRHHHLRSEGKIDLGDGNYFFKGKIWFSSEIPSVEDRGRANVMHCEEGVWNVVHLVANELGRDFTRAKKGNYETFGREIPSDTFLDFEVKLEDLRSLESKNMFYNKYSAIYSLNGNRLISLEGKGSSKLKK